MRKSILLLLLLAALVFTGCLPQTQAPPLASPTPNNRPAPTSIVTVPAGSSVLPASGCTVISQKPTPGPTAETVYPPVTASDWVKGPSDAKVTIIEYSDFQ